MSNNFNLYPAIDIKNGKCVRLLYGDMEKETIYGENPVDQANWFVDQGAKWLHIVDLDGAVQGANINTNVILDIIKNLKHRVKIQLGGGIRNYDQLDFWFQHNVDRVILGSIALENPNFINNLGKEFYKKIVIGTDVRNGMIALHGWKTQSKIKAVDLIKKFDPNILDAVIYTDISKDGTLEGINFDQTINFASSISSPVIASGGIGSLQELIDLKSYNNKGIDGVIIGRALYERKFTFIEAIHSIEEVK